MGLFPRARVFIPDRFPIDVHDEITLRAFRPYLRALLVAAIVAALACVAAVVLLSVLLWRAPSAESMSVFNYELLRLRETIEAPGRSRRAADADHEDREDPDRQPR